MERMKAGNLDEARNIAMDMIFGHEKFVDSSTEEHRSFSSLMEKKYYEKEAVKDGRNVKVNWIAQPISDGFYFLAMVSFQKGKPAEALDYLQKAISWNPVHAAFHVERGFMLLHQEEKPDLGMVQASYLRALELADNFVDFAAALRGMGFTLIEKGDFEGAMACYLRAKLYDPSDKIADKEIDFIKGIAPNAGKDLDGTKAAAVLANRRIPSGIDPIHVKILLEIADEMAAKKSIKEEKAVLRRLLTLDPQNQQAKQRLNSLK